MIRLDATRTIALIALLLVALNSAVALVAFEKGRENARTINDLSALRGAINCVTSNFERSDTIEFVARAAVSLSGKQEYDRLVRLSSEITLPRRTCQELPGVTPAILRKANNEVVKIRLTQRRLRADP